MAYHVIKHVVKSDSEWSSSDEEFVTSASESSSSSQSALEGLIFPKRNKLHRISDFVEKTCKSYSDQEFKEHFRLNRRTCSHLIDKIIEDQVLPAHFYGRTKISAEKAVLMTIWYLSNTETFREMADRFDVTKSSVYRTITRVVTYLVVKSKNYITWPNEQRKHMIRRGFKNKRGIQHVIGAVDGSHINIDRPVKDAHVYCNRKSEYSILVQAVCDHERRFIDFMCGEAGSIHDSRLLKRSALYENGVNGMMGTDVLLGDSAYPCLMWLIPPFKDNGALSQNQTRFNSRHSSTRVVIEHAFGSLKGRFRRLRHFNNLNILFVVKCVVAAAVLHNICIAMNDEMEHMYQEDPNEELDPAIIQQICGMVPRETRRNQMLREMFPEG